MKIKVKIFIISGINDKTIQEELAIRPGSTLGYLLGVLQVDYQVDLTNNNNAIVLLNGESISTRKELKRVLMPDSEFIVMPMLSGG